MFEVILHEPEIPPNTGNVVRLCANAGCRLHLIEPLGFDLTDARLRRAGLDYHEYADVSVHATLDACLAELGTALDTQEAQEIPMGVQGPKGGGHPSGPRVFAFSTRGHMRHDQLAWRAGDVLLFGAETRGLPPAILESLPMARRVRLPMRPNNRSLNLGNAVAIAVYEAWRQLGFEGAV